jgi:hypothetical protein
MSPANESRLEAKVGGQHHRSRPFHFPSLSQDERIRKVFGLPEETPLPRVADETLASYYDHLVAQLSLPFEALYCKNDGEMRQLIHYVHVVELADPRPTYKHNLHGLVCKAQNLKEILDLPLVELGVRDDNPNCQLIDDYAYWFVNWR